MRWELAVFTAALAACSSDIAAGDEQQAKVLRVLDAAEDHDSVAFTANTRAAMYRVVEYAARGEVKDRQQPRSLRMTDLITDGTPIKYHDAGAYKLKRLSTQAGVVVADYECPEDWADCGAKMKFVFRDGQIAEVQNVFLGMGG